MTVMSRIIGGNEKAGRTLRVALMLKDAGPAPAAFPGFELVPVPPLDATAAVLTPPPCHVLVVEIDTASTTQFAALETYLADGAGRVPVIVAAREPGAAFVRRALLAGACDVVPLPLDMVETATALERARGIVRERADAQAAQQRGHVVALLGARGGVGRTMIAGQAGLVWAAKRRTCLIDMDLQQGNAALSLDLRPGLTLADAVDADDRLDLELFRSIADAHPSGLHLFAAPGQIMPLDMLTPEFVRRMLALATDAYEVTLVDMPTTWVPWSRDVLEAADAIVLVTTMSVAGIHQARRQIEVIDANGFSDKLHLLLNRVTHPMFGRFDLKEAQQMLGRKVAFAVADDPATVAAALDKGTSIGAIKSRSRVEKDLKTFVDGVEALFLGEQEDAA